MANDNPLNDKQLLEKLIYALNGLNKKMRDDTQDNIQANRISRSRSGGIITSEEVVRDFRKLRTQLEYTIDNLAKTSSVSGSFRKALYQLITPSENLRRVFNESSKMYRDSLRFQSNDFKKVASDTFDSFNKIVTSGRGVAGTLDKVFKVQESFQDVFGNFKEMVGNASETLKQQAVLSEAMKTINSERIKKMIEIKSRKNNSIDATRQEEELEVLNKKYQELTKEVAGLATKNLDYKNKYQDFIDKAVMLQKDNINILGSMNASDLEFDKFIKAEQKEQEKIINNLTKNLKAVNNGINGFEAAINHQNQATIATHKRLLKGLGDFTKGFIYKGVPQIAKDYQARLANNVTTYNPIAALDMGMTSADLSTLIGQNKTLFRILGKGDENAPIASGQLKELQNLAKIFGVNGKEAAELAVRFANLNLQMGGTGDGIKQQMEDFKKLSAATGTTTDELMSFYEDLNKTGAILALNARYSDRDETNRRAAINRELDIRIRLNKELGYNTEYLQTQNQLRINQQNAGVESTIRRSIAESFLRNEYNRLNPNSPITNEEFKLAQGMTPGSIQSIAGQNPDMAASISRTQQKLASVSTQSRNQIDENIAKNALSGKGGAAFTDIFQRLMVNDIIPSIDNTYSDSNMSTQAAQAMQTARTQLGVTSDKQVDEALAKGVIGDQWKNIFGTDFANKALDQIKFDQVGKASDKLTATFDALGKAATIYEEKRAGLEGNPIVASLLTDSAYMNIIASVINLLSAGRGAGLLGKLLSKTAGVGGAVAESIAGTRAAGAVVGGVTGAFGAESIAAIGAAGISSIVTAVLSVGIAAIGGWSLGKLINNIVDESDFGKNIDKEVEAKYGDKSPLLSTAESLWKKYGRYLDISGSSLVQNAMEDNMRANPAYQAKLDERLNLLDSGKMAKRFLRYGSEDFGSSKSGVSLIDQEIFKGLKDGAINLDDIKNYGANDKFISKLEETLQLSEKYNSNDAIQNSDLEPWQKAILEMRDITKDQAQKEDAHKENQKLHQETQAEIQKRIDQNVKASQKQSQMAIDSIP